MVSDKDKQQNYRDREDIVDGMYELITNIDRPTMRELVKACIKHLMKWESYYIKGDKKDEKKQV